MEPRTRINVRFTVQIPNLQTHRFTSGWSHQVAHLRPTKIHKESPELVPRVFARKSSPSGGGHVRPDTVLHGERAVRKETPISTGAFARTHFRHRTNYVKLKLKFSFPYHFPYHSHLAFAMTNTNTTTKWRKRFQTMTDGQPLPSTYQNISPWDSMMKRSYGLHLKMLQNVGTCKLIQREMQKIVELRKDYMAYEENDEECRRILHALLTKPHTIFQYNQTSDCRRALEAQKCMWETTGHAQVTTIQDMFHIPEEVGKIIRKFICEMTYIEAVETLLQNCRFISLQCRSNLYYNFELPSRFYNHWLNDKNLRTRPTLGTVTMNERLFRHWAHKEDAVREKMIKKQKLR